MQLFLGGVTTNSDAYDAARVRFGSTLSAYGKQSREHKQKIFYLADRQLAWISSLIPDTPEANVALAQSSDEENDDSPQFFGSKLVFFSSVLVFTLSNFFLGGSPEGSRMWMRWTIT